MKNNKGFSLVELIVVIAIMAILAAVAVASYSIYIQKANDAADNEYKSNAEYAATLVATEHQFELVEVELEDIVDGPEDIALIVNNNGEEQRYTFDSHPDIIQEIYDIIGDWTFSYACDHTSCGILENQPATCTAKGYIKYGCGKEVDLPIDEDAHTWGERVPVVEGVYRMDCKNVLKYEDENGYEIIEECQAFKYVNDKGFQVVSPFETGAN